MKILYIDCPMGISGDMFLGALIDMGVDLKMILRELKKLPVDKINVKVSKEVRHSISATAFRVKIKEERHHRTFKDIKKIITKSTLAPEVKDLSVKIFENIADAEGKIHGISPEEVHFHEVGAMDSIIDIVGAAVAVRSLKADAVISSPIPLGSGWTDTMHGRLPIPAPATLEILKGVPLRPSTAPFELTTPTGAAIIKTLAGDFGGIPAMKVERIGYGAGKKDFREAANVLRLMTGEGEIRRGKETGGRERLTVLETNIDDMSPQVAGYVMEKLFGAGALDCFFTPVQMKKGRPGVLLTVLAAEEEKEKLMDIIFDETTTIGVRSYPVERLCLERKIVKVKTPYGTVRLKVAYKDGHAVNIQPEYEDCRLIAEKKGLSLRIVTDGARAAFKEG